MKIVWKSISGSTSSSDGNGILEGPYSLIQGLQSRVSPPFHMRQMPLTQLCVLFRRLGLGLSGTVQNGQELFKDTAPRSPLAPCIEHFIAHP